MNTFHEHEDYADYCEFGPEQPDIPEEYGYCLFCEYYDAASSSRRVLTAYGDELFCRPCLAAAALLVEEDTPAITCKHFLPGRAALSAAKAAALCRE